MNDELALLRAILDNPEDDVLRLVYADCIEENGHRERAEFIRDQIRTGEYAVGNELDFRSPKFGGGKSIVSTSMEYRFRRGFLESVSTSLEIWMKTGDILVARHPITSVSICDKSPMGWRTKGRWSFVLRDAFNEISLPDDIFHLVCSDQRVCRSGPLFVEFKSPIDARKALEEAAFFYVKQLVGDEKKPELC